MQCVSSAGKFGKTWGALAVALLLGGATSLASAQAAPGVALACPTPTSQGVTTVFSTGTDWEIQGPTAAAPWAAAARTSNPSWATVAGMPWIGNGATTALGTWNYRRRIDASDPSIDPASVTTTYRYMTDDASTGAPTTVSFGNLNGTTLPMPNSGFGASRSGGPLSTPLVADNYLTVTVPNTIGVYGLAMEVTLTYNCRPAAPAPVPADAPWALISLSGLMLAGVAAVRRRKRVHAAGAERA